MSEITSYSQESGALFETFFHRYQLIYGSENPPDYFVAGSDRALVNNFLRHVKSAGRNLTLYHGTHSGHISKVAPRKIFPPLYLAVNPFQSAQYALQRAWTESGHRRAKHLPPVDPVLYEIHIDLRGLPYEVFHPSLYAHVTKEIGIGANINIQHPDRHELFEVQLVGKNAENRLKQGRVDIVASGNNLIRILRWSQQNIGHFPLEVLLPK